MSSVMSVARVSAARDDRIRRLSIVLVLVALAIGAVAAQLALGGRTFSLLALEAIILPAVLWRWPSAGVTMLVLAAALTEQYPIPPAIATFPFVTDEIGYFTSLSDGVGIAGVLISPLELAIVIMAGVWLVKAAADRRLSLPTSPLGIGIAILGAAVLLAEVLGRMHGGDLRESLREMRPWVYIVALYLLSSQLLGGRRALRALLWALVIGTGIKGIQGTLQFINLLGVEPRPDYILSHEEAVFFGVFILLTAALWIYGQRGRLRTVATLLLPAVVIANLANNRRASWLILIGGFAVLFVAAWVRLPERRPLLKKLTIGIAVTAALYFPVFWNSTSLLAQPARAVRSAVSPYERDLLSNQYRVYEDANLMLDIRRSAPFGLGFGVPIDYSGIPFHDLTRANPSLRYEPHNGVLYIWLRLGSLGALVFWFVIGAGIIAACRAARSPDTQLALYGALTLCALIAYVVEGYYDLGLSAFRIAVFMGCILGGLEAARLASSPRASTR